MSETVLMKLLKENMPHTTELQWLSKEYARQSFVNEKSILPVSSLMTGEYGLNDVVLSIPAVVDETGVQKVIPIELNDEELTKLKDSANILKDIAKDYI